MPYVTPGDVTTGTTITSAWGNLVGNATDFLANPPACRVYHNTTQSLTDSTETTLAFNSERWDTNTMHDTVTNNSRITLTTAGIYLVTFNGQLASGADYGLIYVLIRQGGTNNIAGQTIQSNGATASPLISVATQYKFAAADYIEVRAYQDNAANAARNVQSSNFFTPEFSATWIGTG